jgi:hypothetical protein
MVLFLVVTHDPKTRLTSQGEHALIRPWLWTLVSDVGSYMVAGSKQGLVIFFISLFLHIIQYTKGDQCFIVSPFIVHQDTGHCGSE